MFSYNVSDEKVVSSPFSLLLFYLDFFSLFFIVRYFSKSEEAVKLGV